MFKLVLEKAEESETKLPTSTGSSKKQEFQKNICFCFIDYAKACDCVDHNKLWKILKEMGMPDYLTCLLRNLYAGQEATVRTGHGTTDWFQIGKGVRQACILSPDYFTYMQSTSWEMLGWMKHKLESRLPGLYFKHNTTSPLMQSNIVLNIIINFMPLSLISFKHWQEENIYFLFVSKKLF